VFRSAPRARGLTRVSSAAESTNVAASSPNAAPAPTVSISTVPIAGPTMIARLAVRPLRAWASWTWVSGTVCGTRPAYAGLKNARAAPNSASITINSATLAPPAKIIAASVRCSPARTLSAPIMILRRPLPPKRSAHTPPNRISAIIGSACAASTKPRSVADPVRSVTYNASATITTWSPMLDADWPRNRYLKLGKRSTRR
jgi:hypothetical protein